MYFSFSHLLNYVWMTLNRCTICVCVLCNIVFSVICVICVFSLLFLSFVKLCLDGLKSLYNMHTIQGYKYRNYKSSLKLHSAVVYRSISFTYPICQPSSSDYFPSLPFPTAPPPLQVQLVRAQNRTTFSYSVIRSLLKMT